MNEKLHYLIEAALAVAVIILFVLVFGGRKGAAVETKEAVSVDNTETKSIPIAYIDVDSLLMNYTFAIDLNEQMAKKLENYRANMTEQLRKFEADAAEFDRKAKTNAFLSRERAEAEQQRILRKQEELQKKDEQYKLELADEQKRSNEELTNTIITKIREFNKDKKYHLIFGKMNDNILYADNAYNITAEVIEFLNSQSKPSSVLKPE